MHALLFFGSAFVVATAVFLYATSADAEKKRVRLVNWLDNTKLYKMFYKIGARMWTRRK